MIGLGYLWVGYSAGRVSGGIGYLWGRISGGRISGFRV